MKRPLTALVAAGTLVALSAAPAAAQEDLGFEIDIHEGFPGDVVSGQVDTDDVAEHCNADAEALQPRFTDTFHAFVGDPPFSGGLADEFMPGFDPNAPDLGGFTIDDFDQLVDVLTFATMAVLTEQVGLNLDLAEEAFPQTFIMTFADIATQEPIGEMGNFDRETGEGSVVVPDLDPGFWAVAAACVSPSTDPELLTNAVHASRPLVEEFITTQPEFEEVIEALPITDPSQVFAVIFGALLIALEIGEEFVPPLMEPDALGAEIFCIFDADGECPEEAPPPPPADEDEEAPPARAVVAQPDFTG